jgi:predicted nucleotidyltransferase
MASITDKLTKKGLIRPPGFINSNIQYEVMMGSIAYGCSNNVSDIDVYGFCIPPRDIIFPHLKGVILGFDRQVQAFDQFQIHHIKDGDNKREYDLSIYNIIKYFRLVMDNNPNMVDSLFVPRRCVLHSTRIGELVRENRHLFLSKKCFHSFSGYAYSQLKKLKTKAAYEYVNLCKTYSIPDDITLDQIQCLKVDDTVKSSLTDILKRLHTHNVTNRLDGIKEKGLDTKFAYHLVRLLLECEQILETQDLDLERDREIYKDIRAGNWPITRLISFFASKEKELKAKYDTSKLRYLCDHDKIKELLFNCLEEHFGSLNKVIVTDNKIVEALRQIQDISNKALRFIK